MTEPIDMEAIERRANAATEGPWAIEEDEYDRTIYMVEDPPSWGQIIIADRVNQGDEPHDAEFIAHAREDIPALLSALRERDERIVELERLRKPASAERRNELLDQITNLRSALELIASVPLIASDSESAVTFQATARSVLQSLESKS